jgi:hypothetical protein
MTFLAEEWSRGMNEVVSKSSSIHRSPWGTKGSMSEPMARIATPQKRKSYALCRTGFSLSRYAAKTIAAR